MSKYKPTCKVCGDEFPLGRFQLGYAVCLECGEEIAMQKRYTVVPMHKSNYVACFNLDDLKGINNKGGLIK
jgi:RNA polymerase-binding transcription factor DksA